MPAFPDRITRSGPSDTNVLVGDDVVQGMYRSVANITRRNQINDGNRLRGMIVRVFADANPDNNCEWELAGSDLTNTGWTKVERPGGGIDPAILGDPNNLINSLITDGLLEEPE